LLPLTAALCLKSGESSIKKYFPYYFSLPVFIFGLIFPVLLSESNTEESISLKDLMQGGWIAVVYLASSYIVLSVIGFFKRDPYLLVPPFLGYILIQFINHWDVVGSTSSTSALGYLMAPIIQIVLALPIGIMLGLLVKSAINGKNKIET
jgi:hypothetical protein